MHILQKLLLGTFCAVMAFGSVAYAASYTGYEAIVEGVSGPATNDTIESEIGSKFYLTPVALGTVTDVLTEEEVRDAEAALEKARAEAEAKRKAEEEARRKAEEEARRKAEEAAKGTYIGDFLITFYTPDPGENGGYATTCTGKSLEANTWKVIAVDPGIIPLGSTVYIEGLGTFTAEDIGGAINGNHIDVLVDYGEAEPLGVKRDVKVYVK